MVNGPGMFGPKREQINSINILLAVAVAVAAAYSIAWYVYSFRTRPTLKDYEGASSHIHAQWARGDVLAVTPFWAERIREYAGDLDVINPPNLVGEDLSRQRRLWLLSVFGYANDHDLLGTLSKKYHLATQKRFGKLDLYLFDLAPPANVGYDFYERVQDARVTVARGADRKECTWRDKKWACAPSSWEYVGQTILDVDDNPRRCLWAHPVTGGIVTIEYSNVTLSRRIVGNHGLTAAAARVPDGMPVTLEVEIDGREMHRSTNLNKKGWNRFEVDTAAYAGTPHTVTFKITTPRDGMRHYCFTADVRE